MHAVSKQRCAVVVGPAPSGAASPQRCAAAAARAEAPERRCPAGHRKPIDTIQPAKVSLPVFPAVTRGNRDHLRVEVRSGSPINLVSETIADMFGFDIVIDDYGYDDYVDVDQSFVLPSGIVGLTSFSLFHDGHELFFDGFVVEDAFIANDDMNVPVDVIAGAPFMEQNDVSVRPSQRRITFGDSHVFTYASHAVDHYDSPAELIGTAPIEMKNVCETPCEHNETKTECEHINETKTECEHNETKTECEHINETKRECEDNETKTVSEHIHIEMNAECELNETTVYDRVTTVCDHVMTVCEHNETSVCQYKMMECEHSEMMLKCKHRMKMECKHNDTIDSEHNEMEMECCDAEQETQCEDTNVYSRFSCTFCVENEDLPPFDECYGEHFGRVVEFEPNSTDTSQSGVAPQSLIAGRDIGYIAATSWTEHSSGHLSVEPGSGHPLPDYRSGIPVTVPRSATSCANHLPGNSLACTRRSASCDAYADPFTTHIGHSRKDVVEHGNGVSFHEGSGFLVDNAVMYSSPGCTVSSSDRHADHVPDPDGPSPRCPCATTGAEVLHPIGLLHSAHSQLIPTATRHGQSIYTLSDQPAADDTIAFPADRTTSSRAAEPDSKLTSHVTSDPHTPNADDDAIGLHPLLNDVGPTYYDATGLHPLLDDVGPACFDASPTWSSPPRTCGPRPPSFTPEGGPSPCPDDGALHAFHLLSTKCAPGVPRAPTLGITDLASMDVNRPPVPWIADPSAPHDSAGLAVPSLPPMSPLTPG